MTVVTFDNFNLRDYADKINDIRRPIMASREHTLVDIPGMAGAKISRSKSGVKIIEIDVQLFGSTKEEIRTKTKTLAGVLFTEKPASMTFSDEPGIVYTSIVTDETPFEELSKLGKTTIKFLCPDPYAVGVSVNKAIVDGQVVSIGGTAPMLPKFTITLTGTRTFVRVLYNGKEIKINYNFIAGDVVVIDHMENLVTINGTINNQTVDVTSDFFVVQPGNAIFSTVTLANVTMDYNERWL